MEETATRKNSTKEIGRLLTSDEGRPRGFLRPAGSSGVPQTRQPRARLTIELRVNRSNVLEEVRRHFFAEFYWHREIQQAQQNETWPVRRTRHQSALTLE
jgi:hypothetical protein